jgi:hypothetical protein
VQPPGILARSAKATGRVLQRRALRLIALVVVILLIVVGWSYVHALTAPGTDSLGAKSVEWVRGHGGGGIVAWVEKKWYSDHKPPAGGTVLAKDLPKFPSHPAGYYHSSSAALAAPASVAPIIHAALAGEGHWVPIGRPVDGAAAVYATYLRPDPAHTSVVTGVAWMDTNLLHAELFPGYQVPGGSGWSPSSPIRASDGELVTAFNSGFRLQDAAGSGYYSMGRTVAPIISGYASLVIYNNGKATVGAWGTEVTDSPNIVSIRQNLALIVDQGHPVAGLTDNKFQKWGATLGNNQYVWRSGIGVTADGALVYAAGADLSIATLADVLARSGAVRAMELDINTDWVDYFSFDPPSGAAAGPANASKLMPAMVSSTKRYFEPSSRDFIAMFANN